MSVIRRNLPVFALCALATMAGAHAQPITLTGNGVTITYEDRAAAIFGAPSLIASSATASWARFAGVGSADMGPLDRRASGVAVATGEEELLSFADAVALSFSLDDTGQRESDLFSLLLAGMGLFVLIARQRLAARSRIPNVA